MAYCLQSVFIQITGDNNQGDIIKPWGRPHESLADILIREHSQVWNKIAFAELEHDEMWETKEDIEKYKQLGREIYGYYMEAIRLVKNESA